MKTIHILESDTFLLGIDSADIHATFTPRQFQETFQDEKYLLLSPAGLFLQKKPNITGSESLIVQVSNVIDHPFLLFDREITRYSSEPLHEFPNLYPETVRSCCPEAIIHHDEIVLCLNPDKLYELYTKTSSSENLLIHSDDFFNGIELLQKQASTRHEPDKESSDKTKTTTNVKIHDPVMKIISWIAEKYDKQKSSVIRPADIPLELSRKADLDNTALQYLIDQTLTRLQSKRNKG